MNAADGWGTDRPLADKGLTSYRYRGTFGWIMIGAKDDRDALSEAKRSISDGFAPTIDKLEVWAGDRYVSVESVRPTPEDLPAGATWGGTLSVDELRAGDVFVVPGTPRMARLSGTVVKVSRANITYETVYAPSPTMEQTLTLKARKVDLCGGRVRRADVVYEIVGGTK